ncbi:MAG: hypothetical protein R3E39_12825 [Anaerolineae bacterium]
MSKRFLIDRGFETANPLNLLMLLDSQLQPAYTPDYEFCEFSLNDVHDAELTSGQTQETAARVLSETLISNQNRLSRK